MLRSLSDSYDLMLECWHENSHDRPPFSALRTKFGTLLQAGSADAYIELQIDEQKPYYQVKEEETGGRRGSVSSTSSEESIDKQKGKEKEGQEDRQPIHDEACTGKQRCFLQHSWASRGHISAARYPCQPACPSGPTADASGSLTTR